MTQQRKLAILLLKRAKKETQITKFHIFGTSKFNSKIITNRGNTLKVYLLYN
jgi:hypothetical protein